MKTTAVITMMPMAMMNRKVGQPLLVLTLQPSEGSRAAIEVKIRTDMPLPTPRSVIISPNHMITPVPAVIVMTSVATVTQSGILVCGTIGYWVWSHLPLNSCPERASATNAEAWRMARPSVRYRVYWVIFAWPAWPSLRSVSSRGITTVSSWRMMLDVM